jgi:hypothetical protein
MEINTTTATIYSIPTVGVPTHGNDVEKISIWRLPKIAWASGILLGINLMIAGSIAISPELDVSIYGEAAGDVVLAHAKPSPFSEPEQKPRPVRQAMKMKPVVELLPEVAAAMDVELANMPVRSASMSLPRQSERPRISAPTAVPAVYRQPAYASGSSAIEASEKQMDFPRISASLTPRSATPSTFTGTQDITPRKAIEREARPAVLN